MTIEKEFVIEYIKKKNYWWERKEIEKEDKGIERREYIEKIEEPLKLERIVCLSGIRRSGKTTLLFQLIDNLIKEGTEPNYIVYIKVDDIIGKFDDLRELVNLYHELQGIDPKREQVIFIFDEIHFLKNWHFQLKYFIDSKYKSKFIISGSSKTLLYRDASESLAGRIRFIDVFPLTFKEFLRFNGIEIKDVKSDKFEDIKKFYHDLLPKKDHILYLFNKYLSVGGFPEWFKVKDENQWQKILVDDYFSLILFKDIVSVFRARDPFLLEKLAKETALFSTERFSYSNLSNRMGMDRETVKRYLYYLASSGLIFISEVYFKTKKAREKVEKKIYFWEEGLRKALTFDKDEGRSVENMVAWHLIKKGLELVPFFEPYYWKNKYEVDFVFDGKELLPVEIKYRENPRDVKGIIEFSKNFSITKSIVITKDLFENEEKDGVKIQFIPAWLFLLII